MRLPLICSYCMRENGPSARPIAVVTFRDDGRYEAQCPNGHTSIVLLQEQKFELLFEIGAYAIVDGYYREAVSSFTSSLERLYEFFIKSSLFQQGLIGDKIDEIWKLVSSQSERQFGAFIFLYARDFGGAPPTLKRPRVEFRNDVIHKGKIPSHDEAIEYGQAVLDVIRPVLQSARERYPDGTQKAVFHHLASCRAPGDDGKPVATMSIPTIVSRTSGPAAREAPSLDEAIKGLRRWR